MILSMQMDRASYFVEKMEIEKLLINFISQVKQKGELSHVRSHAC